MLSKFWATYEVNFGERKIHRALEYNLTFLTRQSDSQEVRRDTNHSSNKCFSQNTFNLGNLKSHRDT